VLIEHYGGKFPMWLAPEQVKVLPITDDQLAYAEGVVQELRDHDLRVSIDRRSERIGAKIRLARNERVPFMVVVGAKEQETGSVTLRDRDGNQQPMALDALAAHLGEQCKR